MTLAFATVCEAEADFRTSTGLADRVLCAKVEWIEQESLDDYRRWRGLAEAAPYVLWKRVATRAREAGFRVHGHFDGEPGQPDAHAARRALWLLKRGEGPLDGVLLIRDDDRQTARRQGLEQARQESSLTCPILIGLAHLKRECWVLGGYEPESDSEMERLSFLIEELTFDPRTEADRLAAREDGEVRSAKRVLRVLTNNDLTREEKCWREATLELLRSRGKRTGLTDYLDEVKTRLVPLFTGRCPAE